MPIENLILIPTEFESGLIASQLDRLAKTEQFVLRHCGFGPIAAAAVATEAIIAHEPKRVILLGIAGAYQSTGQPAENDLGVGNAYRFSSVTIDGVGVGASDEFQSATDLGWAHFSGDDHRGAINDEIELATKSPHRLLTVCAASATSDQAQRRQKRYGASAEDMEGFAVAMACRLRNVPLEIIRGISNVAGDRDKSNWAIPEALGSAAGGLEHVMGEQA